MISREEIENMSLDDYIEKIKNSKCVSMGAAKAYADNVRVTSNDTNHQTNTSGWTKHKYYKDHGKNYGKNRLPSSTKWHGFSNRMNGWNHQIRPRNNTQPLGLFTRKNNPYKLQNNESPPNIVIQCNEESLNFDKLDELVVAKTTDSTENFEKIRLNKIAEEILSQLQRLQTQSHLRKIEEGKKLKYDFKLQNDIATIQNRSLLVEHAEQGKITNNSYFKVVTSNGPGINNLSFAPQNTDVTMNQRFA